MSWYKGPGVYFVQLKGSPRKWGEMIAYNTPGCPIQTFARWLHGASVAVDLIAKGVPVNRYDTYKALTLGPKGMLYQYGYNYDKLPQDAWSGFYPYKMWFNILQSAYTFPDHVYLQRLFQFILNAPEGSLPEAGKDADETWLEDVYFKPANEALYRYNRHQIVLDRGDTMAARDDGRDDDGNPVLEDDGGRMDDQW